MTLRLAFTQIQYSSVDSLTSPLQFYQLRVFFIVRMTHLLVILYRFFNETSVQYFSKSA